MYQCDSWYRVVEGEGSRQLRICSCGHPRRADLAPPAIVVSLCSYKITSHNNKLSGRWDREWSAGLVRQSVSPYKWPTNNRTSCMCSHNRDSSFWHYYNSFAVTKCIFSCIFLAVVLRPLLNGNRIDHIRKMDFRYDVQEYIFCCLISGVGADCG